MATKECILTWAKEYWPQFNRMPYDYRHFYKIAEREGIQVKVDNSFPLDVEMEECFSFTSDNWIFINAHHGIPEGDTLVCTYAKLFNWYYLNDENFLNFHSCLSVEGRDYKKLCLTAGFLAVAPSRMLIDDLRVGIEPMQKYRFSLRFAHRRVKLLLNHLTQLEGRNSQKDIRRLIGEEGVSPLHRLSGKNSKGSGNAGREQDELIMKEKTIIPTGLPAHRCTHSSSCSHPDLLFTTSRKETPRPFRQLPCCCP